MDDKKDIVNFLELKKWSKSIFEKKIKSKKKIEESFIKHIKSLNLNKLDKDAILKSIHLIDGNKLLFRLSDGKLKKVTLKKNYSQKNNKVLSDVSLYELYCFAREKSMEFWGREFDIEIELVNTYWKNQNGSYIYYIQEDRSVIRMSSKRNMYRSKEQVLSTLLHEMVHWHLHTIGLPYHDDDKEFIEEIQRVGSHISGTKKAQKAFNDLEKLKKDAE